MIKNASKIKINPNYKHKKEIKTELITICCIKGFCIRISLEQDPDTEEVLSFRFELINPEGGVVENFLSFEDALSALETKVNKEVDQEMEEDFYTYR